MLWQGSLRGCICHILDESNTQKAQKPKNDIYTNVVILHKKVLNAKGKLFKGQSPKYALAGTRNLITHSSIDGVEKGTKIF